MNIFVFPSKRIKKMHKYMQMKPGSESCFKERVYYLNKYCEY